MPLFLPALADELCQGDVFLDLVIPDALAATGQTRCSVILLTNDCDIDKPKFRIWQVARVVAFTELTGEAKSIIGEVRNGRFPAAMLLPDVPVIGEAFVDFRHIHRVPRELMTDALTLRIASMTEDARIALFDLLHTFYRRRQAPRGNAQRAPAVEVVRPNLVELPQRDEALPELPE